MKYEVAGLFIYNSDENDVSLDRTQHSATLKRLKVAATRRTVSSGSGQTPGIVVVG